MKRVKKILKIFTVTIISIVVAALLFIQTSWFKDILKNKIIKIVNQEINGTIEIEKIKANFFSTFEINGILLLDAENETIAQIDKIGLRYFILDLLVGQVTVNNFYINLPKINLIQHEDNSWNFEKLIISDTTKTDNTSSNINLKLSFLVKKVRIKNGLINITANDTIIPQKVDNLNMNISALYNISTLLAKMNHFSLETAEPDFILNNLEFAVNYDSKNWFLDNLILSTAENSIAIDGNYMDLNNFALNLNWNQINSEEFKDFLPPIEIVSSPDLNLTIKNSDSAAEVDINLINKNNQLSILGNILNFGNLIENGSSKQVETDLNIILRDINPNSWIKIEPINLIVNSTLNIFSEDILNYKKPVLITGNINNSSFEELSVSTGNLDVAYLPEQILAKIDIISNAGQISGNADVITIDDTQKINTKLSFNNILLHKIVKGKLENSIVNSEINANGSIKNSRIDIDFDAKCNNIIVEHIWIDTLSFFGNYNNDHLKIENFILNNNSILAKADLSLQENSFFDATLNLNLKNIDEFSHYIEQEINWESMQFNATANGSLDSLVINALTNIEKIQVDSLVSVGKINLKTKGELIDNNPFIDGDIEIFEIIKDNIQIDTTTINYSIANTLWNIDLSSSLLENKIFTKIAGHLNNFNSVEIENLEVSNNNNSFKLIENTLISYNDSLIFIDKLNFIDEHNINFSWKSNLLISKESIEINTDLKNLNLKIFNDYNIIDEKIEGLFNFNLNVSQNSGKIQIDGESNIAKINFEHFFIDKINAVFGYDNELLNSKISVLSTKNDSLILNTKLPITIAYNDSLHFSWNQNFEANLYTKNLLLNNYFEKIKNFNQPEALLNMDLTILSNRKNPQFQGYLNIDKGALPLSKYGIDYKEIKLRLNAENNIINLDSLYIHQKGWLLGKGFLELDSLKFGEYKNVSLSIKSDNFQLANHKNYDALINSDITLTHSETGTKYGGFVKILRSSFNLDALTDFGDSQHLDAPMLIQALEENRDSISSTIDESIVLPRSQENDLLKNLTGTLKVEIPRNCWVKSDDMQMELYGNVDVIKNSTFFEIFGSLGVHRGFYTFYGKKMVIKEGDFTFSGGETFNPALNLNALYTFRTPEREKKVLSLNVGGDLQEPLISFSIDKQDIPEADAIAYLLFGQPFDQLNHGNQSGVNDAITSRLFSNMIASQLSKTLGKTLNLDFIEVDPTDNWQNTTFTVGKYLTNDLFVTYQRSFGESDDNEISRETISLEYEMTKKLSLRLLKGKVKKSGIDLIIKLEK